MLRKVIRAPAVLGSIMGGILVAAMVLVISVAVGVWPPDIFTLKRHSLAEMTTKEGYHFRVVQYWNQIDFYSTEFHVTLSDGSLRAHTLDGDDSKKWRAMITVDEEKRTVAVSFPGSAERSFAWDEL